MWTLVLLLITSRIPDGSWGELLLCLSDWLEFSCNYPEQVNTSSVGETKGQQGDLHMECVVNIRCHSAATADKCNSSICSSIVSTGSSDASGHLNVDAPKISIQPAGASGQVEVDAIPSITATVNVGDSFSHLFAFKSNPFMKKFISKNQLNCPHLEDKEHFTLNNNESSSNVSIHMRNVTHGDLGIYWFGVKDVGLSQDCFFFLKFIFIPVPASGLPTVAPPNHPSMPLVSIVVVSICVLLLVPLLLYKRFSQKHRHAEAFENGVVNAVSEFSENHYEEIVPHTAAKTIHVTAHFYTNHHLSDSGAHSSTDNSTVNLECSECSMDHLYSTLTLPTQ